MVPFFTCLIPLLAQTHLPNLSSPTTYHPTTPVDKVVKMPNYYDPNRDKIPYYNPTSPTTTTYRVNTQTTYPNTQSYYDPNNPSPPLSSSDGQQISYLIQRFLKGILDNQLETIYQSDTHTYFRNATSFDQFKYFVTTHPALTKSKGIFLGGSNVQGDTAIVSLDITNLENNTEPFDFYLLRENGLWKILGILTNELPAQTFLHETLSVK